MNRLQSELNRLYSPEFPDPPGTPAARAGQHGGGEQSSLIDASGRVRAMVLALARPADWSALATVWRGVQVDLDLPAPAISVSGKDAYQLWFSLAQPLPAPAAMAFLDALRLRYLGDIKPQRIGMMPQVDPASTLSAPPALHAPWVPAEQGESGRWSAYVAPDLAPVFGDEPWLDLPPNPDGQANLLSRLQSIPLADFQLALAQLRPASLPVSNSPPAPDPLGSAGAVVVPLNPRSSPVGAWQDPESFLRDVMNNEAVALGLRIEAAKALLQGRKSQ
jgi:hypothetical protein